MDPSKDRCFNLSPEKHLVMRNRLMSTSHEPFYSRTDAEGSLSALPRGEGQGGIR